MATSPIAPIGGSVNSPTDATKKPKDLKDLDINQFLQLMISELTNQDPLNPMDNNELVQQIGSIREIAATDKLTTSLDLVQSGQSLTTASSLIGKTIKALTDENENIEGVVERVSIDVDPNDNSKRTYRVHVDAARFLQRVAKAFEAASERGGEIRLRLSPPELGALRVEVHLSEQGLAARVEVENNDARTVLLENLSALRERLAEQGLRLEKFDVDVSQREPDQQANREFFDQSRDQSAPREPRSVRSPTNPAQAPVMNDTTTPTSGWQDRQLNVIV